MFLGTTIGFTVVVLITCLSSSVLLTHCLTILLFGCQHVGNIMEDHPYLGLDLGNVYFLVYFVELRGQTCHLNNVDPDKYDFYDVIDDIYNFCSRIGFASL